MTYVKIEGKGRNCTGTEALSHPAKAVHRQVRKGRKGKPGTQAKEVNGSRQG
jgi:hypothetical protein